MFKCLSKLFYNLFFWAKYKSKEIPISDIVTDVTLKDNKTASLSYKDKISRCMECSHIDDIIVEGEGPKVLIFMDDLRETGIIIDILLNDIKIQFDYDVLKEYTVYKILGTKAGCRTINFINNLNKKIDKAILDITINESLVMEDLTRIELDGIDVGLHVLEKNNAVDNNLLFLTAHTLDNHNPLIKHYIDKYKVHTGNTLSTVAVHKSSKDLREVIYNFLKEKDE